MRSITRECFPPPFCLVQAFKHLCPLHLQSFAALYRQTHFPIMPCLITALLSCISHGSSALPFFHPVLKPIINKHPTTNVPLHCLTHVRHTVFDPFPPSDQPAVSILSMYCSHLLTSPFHIQFGVKTAVTVGKGWNSFVFFLLMHKSKHLFYSPNPSYNN